VRETEAKDFSRQAGVARRALLMRPSSIDLMEKSENPYFAAPGVSRFQTLMGSFLTSFPGVELTGKEMVNVNARSIFGDM
jgi:hypothetical protein